MNKKYFGTDGIRGQYNKVLTIDLAFKIGKAAGSVIPVGTSVCIAQDTRKSSPTIEHALISGLLATGINVDSLGVTPTPCVSYAILKNDYQFGIMISASHNPFCDNGIKFFGKNGKKLSDQLEAEIENKIITNSYRLVDTCELGNNQKNEQIVNGYEQFLISNGADLSGYKICLDCANGSGYSIAPNVFRALGAEVSVIGNQPDGININANVGSTHTEAISAKIKSGNYDFGFAYDGDADRIIIITSNGTVLDGDYILYILAKYFKEENSLKNNLVVSTVMANLGLIEILKKEEIDVVKTSVGDRYVMKAIDENNAVVGGEQSGHIILPDLLPTGDGILVSVFLATIIAKEKGLDNLISDFKKFPQILINKSVENKEVAMKDEKLLAAIEKYEKQLGAEGRILVRASGTEELIRVMVEAKENAICQQISKELIRYVN